MFSRKYFMQIHNENKLTIDNYCYGTATGKYNMMDRITKFQLQQAINTFF